MNRAIATVIVAPMTTQGRQYPTRVPCEFEGKPGHVVLDQIRTIDKSRIVKLLGRLGDEEQAAVLQVLAGMFVA
jgi:mRNA interferase MazF